MHRSHGRHIPNNSLLSIHAYQTTTKSSSMCPIYQNSTWAAQCPAPSQAWIPQVLEPFIYGLCRRSRNQHQRELTMLPKWTSSGTALAWPSQGRQAFTDMCLPDRPGLRHRLCPLSRLSARLSEPNFTQCPVSGFAVTLNDILTLEGNKLAFLCVCVFACWLASLLACLLACVFQFRP